MARHRVDYRRVKVHRSYEVGEVADLLGVHKNTVRKWLAEGLSGIEGARPILIAGDDLRAFLAARRAAAKRPLRLGELFCVACREGKRPAGAMADYLPITDTSGNLAGVCPDCEKMIYRRVRLDRIEHCGAGLDIAFPQAQPGIGGNLWPSSNDDSRG